jgi:hypothetical protein
MGMRIRSKSEKGLIIKRGEIKRLFGCSYKEEKEGKE